MIEDHRPGHAQRVDLVEVGLGEVELGVHARVQVAVVVAGTDEGGLREVGGVVVAARLAVPVRQQRDKLTLVPAHSWIDRITRAIIRTLFLLDK